jgi:hypothetical protein
MTKADQLLERTSERLRVTAEKLARENGLKSKLAQPLAEDADFLRKLKPSLVKARARGELPTDEKPSAARVAPAGPQLGKRPKRPRSGGPNPFVVAGIALVAGVALAKWLDWRGHAHPRV